jgi:hypothetical protein
VVTIFTGPACISSISSTSYDGVERKIILNAQGVAVWLHAGKALYQFHRLCAGDNGFPASTQAETTATDASYFGRSNVVM